MASNDMIIIYTISLFFIILGGVLPLVQSDLEVEQTSYSADPMIDDIGAQQDESSTSIWEILLSILQMFFWTFGDLPFLLDLIVFVPLRLLLGGTIARNIWIGGGG